MPVAAFPAFPADVPTHPLLIVDYELIKARDPKEIERLWEAGTKIGFWYLKNHGADHDVAEMFDMGAETMALPYEEKMRFDQGDDGMSFGYKAAGAYTSLDGDPDRMEFLNIGKDDVLAWPRQAHRSYPSTVNQRMESTIIPFVRKSLEINQTILDVFNDKLGLPDGRLRNLHIQEEFSGDEVRVTRASPSKGPKPTLTGHTDFGSLSFLHNRLGGLQVMPPGSETWYYIKPIPGHAICNIGDAIAFFSGGILHSNNHRVVTPPGEQAAFERWSLVYFTRPADRVVLRALVEDSEMIAEAVARKPVKKFETNSTSKEWIARRVKYMRTNNRKGPETWLASRGTEDL